MTGEETAEGGPRIPQLDGFRNEFSVPIVSYRFFCFPSIRPCTEHVDFKCNFSVKMLVLRESKCSGKLHL